MASASVSSELARLSQAVQHTLDATACYPGLAVVRCTTPGGRLVVDLQHPHPEAASSKDLLQALEGLLRAQMPAVDLSNLGDFPVADTLPVRICLHLSQVPRAYATHTFSWQLGDGAEQLFPPVDGPGPPAPNPETEPPSAHGATEQTPNADDQALPNPIAISASSLPTLDDGHLALPAAQVQLPPARPWRRPRPNREVERREAERRQILRRRYRWWQRQWQRYWGYGVAGLIVVGCSGFAYGLSRPCVVGGCPELEQAEALYQSAQQRLAADPDEVALAGAHQDLELALALVRPVPRWSAHYEAAQAQQQQAGQAKAGLERLDQARALALEAANQSQDPPHPVEHWVDVQLLWQQAIDQLAAVPAESPIAPFSQRKQQEYQANYTAIGRRIAAEEEAEANFNAALQLAQLAEQRLGSATSVAGWQLAVQEWETALQGLNAIPRGTQAYGEAQPYLQQYRQSLLVAQGRARQEGLGAERYQQAIAAAQQAETYASQQQWTLAVDRWQTALAHAQAVPDDTSLAADAAALVGFYEPALAQARAQLAAAVALQGLQQVLDELCQGAATPCQAINQPSQVRVTLMAQYAEALRQSLTPPGADGSQGLVPLTPSPGTDIQRLVEAVATAGQQANRPVVLYDSQGGFIARYRHDLGGFLKN